MRTQIPSLAPGEDAYDVTAHIVLDDSGGEGVKAVRNSDGHLSRR